jgi:DNA repair exonuclease SbcCD nuclease subunit
MRFAYTADLHLSGYSQDKIVDNLPERVYEIKTSVYEIGNYCIQNEIDKIIIGGDLLHNKSLIYSLAQNILLDFFRDFSKIDFLLIDGNHDLSGKGENVVSALRVFNEPNVHRFSDVETSENVLFVPYSTKMVEQIKKNSSDYLVAHFGLNEATLNSGVSIVSDISAKELIGRYKVCLLAHYHKPQVLRNEKIQIYYVGSPTQKDWGEKHEEKRFLDVDTHTNIINSIPTVGYKKHFELTITKENKQEMFEKAKELSAEGHYVKLVTKDKATDWKEISKSLDTKERTSISFSDKSEVDITNRGITSSMSTEDKLNRYLEIKGIPKEKWATYKEKAFNIISETSERTK